MVLNRIFRIQEWLIAKLFFNLAIATAFFVNSGVDMATLPITLLLVALYIIPVGSFGYFCNDLFEKDWSVHIFRIRQPKNLPHVFSAILLTVLIALAVVPFGFILPNPRLYFVLLAIHLGLLFTYPIPVLRIKSSVLGLIWDALYSYVFPAAISITICAGYHELAFAVNPIIVLFGVAWLLSAGLRSILNHQLLDFDNDVLTATNTFTLRYGQKLSRRMMLVIFIAECALFVVLVSISIGSLWIPLSAALIMFAMIELIFRFSEFRKPTKTETAIALTNQLYDYYLFTGFFVYAAVYWHFTALLFPLVFIMIRLNAFSWLYHRAALWVFYKLKGGFKRIKKWF